MSTIEPKKTLYVEYPVPLSQMFSIRVAASANVNVYAMDEAGLRDFLKDKAAPVRAYATSKVGTVHELSVRVPPIAPKWFLVIDNPWDFPTQVEYTVTALVSAVSGITGSGASVNATSTYVGVIDSYTTTSPHRR